MSFWDWFLSVDNPSLPQSEYLYGPRHLAVLAAVVVATIVVSLILAKRSPRAKQIALYVFACVLVFMEVSGRGVALYKTTDYSIGHLAQTLIPMHFCAICVWTFIISIFARCRPLLRASVIAGMLATVLYLLFPAVGLNKTFIGYTEFYSVFTHCFAFVVCVATMAMGATNFKWREIWQPTLYFAIAVLYGVLLNFVIFPGADYMYMREDPLPFSVPGVPYQVFMVVILAGVISLFYAFPSLKRWIQKKVNAKKAVAAPATSPKNSGGK